LKTLELCVELKGFLGEHGDEPVVNPDPWRAKFIGDYCLRFGVSVPKLRDEIRAKAKIDYLDLNNDIELAAKNRNSSRLAVEAIVERLWELAFDINA
jgi:hypothetical protein